MFLRTLSIINFKNIEQETLSFSPDINCLVGDNGAGKTNVVDAVYYLSMCKSAFGMTDGQSLRHGEEFFMLEGAYESDAGRNEQIVCSFARRGGKSVKRAGKEYERLSDHVGLIPVVIVSPVDSALISDAAEERRRFMNMFLSQLDRGYLTAIMRYNSVLNERNRLLKQGPSALQDELLDVLDAQLVKHGTVVYERRAELVERIASVVAEYYRMISEDREQVEVSYRSELIQTPFEELLRASRERDRINQFTCCGIHRDDLVLRIGGYQLRKYGSQGQQKSFLVALKLAQYNIVSERRGERPILLLDDLFDKLDASRVEQLIRLVSGERFGQIFITDCNKMRIERVLQSASASYRLFGVKAGHVEEQ